MRSSASGDSVVGSVLRKLGSLVIVAVGIYLLFQIGFYSVPPMENLPSGATLMIWRNPGEPYFNSPDAMCLALQGGVSLACRGAAVSQAPMDRLIMRLPYIEWVYLASTGGWEFGQ